MGEYTDAKGLVYAIQQDYANGEIAILSDDLAAWRVRRRVLIEASPVFESLLNHTNTSSKEVHLPDIPRIDLDLMIRALHGNPPIDLTFSQAARTIDHLRRHDCIGAARLLLFTTVRDIAGEVLFDAFVLASQLDDLKCGCRILAQGWKWYGDCTPDTATDAGDGLFPDYLSLHPDETVKPWRVEEAEKIKNAWMWSLTLASAACSKLPDSEYWSDPKLWRMMVGEFVTNLVA